METITYSQVQDLVQRLPPQCLPAAYEMLRELTDTSETLQSQLDFMHLPLVQRRAILTHQAEIMEAHYAESADQREAWQAGDFLHDGSAG